ncbi:LysR family transcriptional regulator [Pseudomonas sp. LRF_L74]|uniref:LysR family transcriptional regulator n=1 Tax=Pseudomonas sp. LRF_L74 TaxID=3369422 RepID=UPI003F6276C5
MDDKSINLLHLRTLVRAADTGSLAKAAKRMLRAPSVVKDGIEDLEAQLQARLFERSPHGMTLTAQGQVVLRRARRILAELAVLPAILGQPPVTVHEQLYLLNARRLAIFVCLCELQHMGRVARIIGVSQPAVSAAIKALEAGTDKILFERSQRGVRPTPVALEILLPIRRTLNEAQQIRPDLAVLSGEVRGKVRIGALPLGRTRIIPQAVATVLTRHPHVQVETCEGSFEQLVSDLRAGDIDCLFGALRVDADSDLHSERLLEEDLVILARTGHPLSRATPTNEALEQARWILPRPLTPARHLIDQYFSGLGLPSPLAAVESGDMAIIRGLLARTDLLAVVSAHQFEHDLATGELQSVAAGLAGTRRPIGLITRQHCLHSPAALAFIEAVREASPPAQ